MRHRLYYLLPDLNSARQALDDLLLQRIEQSHIRFLSTTSELPSDLPEAGFMHKTDVVHGAESGMIVGAGLGLALGAVVVYFFPFAGSSSKATIVFLAALIGVLFGGWAASMAAAALPNSRLTAFYPELEKGKILLIVDVPAGRIKEIEQRLAERHPEMKFGGEASHIPVFP
ncbi:MAG: hypothetical protein JWQ23_3746 [Herminiimonas sp.]|jgi:hypothetical protein|nr:hypothetical protein [Herminiimonas sp.]